MMYSRIDKPTATGLCDMSVDGQACRDENGEMCVQCAADVAERAAYFRKLWDAASSEERDPKNWKAPVR
jgi:hypothetical protein